MCEYDYIVVKKNKELDVLKDNPAHKLNYKHLFAVFLSVKLYISKKATTSIHVTVSSIYLKVI
jgi:hypothetical protein